MKGLDEESPMCTIDYLTIRPGHANSGSSKSDLVSGKMKEVVISTIVIQAR